MKRRKPPDKIPHPLGPPLSYQKPESSVAYASQPHRHPGARFRDPRGHAMEVTPKGTLKNLTKGLSRKKKIRAGLRKKKTGVDREKV